jgi:hypothetical protein
METVLSVERSKLLVALYAITIPISGLHRTIIRLHIGDMITYYPPIFGHLRILVYSGLYSIVFYRDISKCRGIKIVSGIIHNYHTDKLVTGNKHLITYLGQGILFFSHLEEV